MVCDLSDSVLRHAVSDPKINGKRIFVFIIGGMTRSEVSSGWLLLEFDKSFTFVFRVFCAGFGMEKHLLWVGLDVQLRVAHKLTPQLRREVVVGSTNIGDPHQFIRVLVASMMSRRVDTFFLDRQTCTC